MSFSLDERPSSRFDTCSIASCRSFATGSVAPASRTAAARVPIVPCISWTRRAGVILLLVCFDDDGTRCEGRPLLVEDGGPLDEGGSDDVLGNDRDDEPMDGDVLLLFFIAGSTDEVSIKAEISNLRLLDAEIAVDDSASLSISIRSTMLLIVSLSGI